MLPEQIAYQSVATAFCFNIDSREKQTRNSSQFM